MKISARNVLKEKRKKEKKKEKRTGNLKQV